MPIVIVTVTANTTLDQTVFLPHFTLGTTIRATQNVMSMGGKPADASFILGALGTPSRALGFAGGLLGKKVEQLLAQRGVDVDFVWVEGETRMCIGVVVEGQGQATLTTTPTMQITPSALDALRAKYIESLDQATVVCLGGTLPPPMQADFYTDSIALARARNIPVVFDGAEPNLSAGLRARPQYIKPNRRELSGLVGRELLSMDDLYYAGREVIAQYGTCPIISMDKDGGLAVLPDRAYFIPPLPITVVNADGAGDGVLAGITASLHRGQPIEEGIRLGFACAAAVCIMPGTADCRAEDVARFLGRVELIPYAPA
jgi:tagatose 6-phosphate kinase